MTIFGHRDLLEFVRRHYIESRPMRKLDNLYVAYKAPITTTSRSAPVSAPQ